MTTEMTIGVATILSGVHFFPQKVDDLFIVVAFKRRSKTTKTNHSHLQISNLPRPAKMSVK